MKKKILIVSALIALLAVAVVGGTLAYFTDTKEVTNTFTMGNVKIEVVEEQYKEGSTTEFETYKNEQPLLPGVETDKFVSVQNTGSNSAYVRVIYRIKKASAGVLMVNIPAVATNSYGISGPADVKIDEVEYVTYTVTYAAPVAASEDTDRILSTVALDPSFDWVYGEDGSVTGYSYKVAGETERTVVAGTEFDKTVTVIAEAIQADGFDTAADAWHAFDAQK